jgi:hypothetical protein
LRADLRSTADAQALIPGKEWDDLAQRMSIVATELATNALNRARSEALVQLSRTKRTLVLDVADDLPSVPPQWAAKRPSGGDGRGLHITQQVAARHRLVHHGPAQIRLGPVQHPASPAAFHTLRIPVSGLTTFIWLQRRVRH